MSTLFAIPAAVKATRPTCLACGAADFHLIDCPVGPDRHTARVLPIDCRPETIGLDPAADAPADADDRAPYSAEDLAWWSAHCDHDGGCHPDALTPEEEDAEWEHSEMLEERAALVASWDMYMAGIPCW